jgi:hypothetical protein
MLSLTALSNWELTVLASIRGATGTLEERDAQITRSGLYAEYPAIFAAYLELALDGDDAEALEAVKRGVFLAWYGFQAPPTTSGIAELPESAIRRLLVALDDAIAGGRTDAELLAMLAWYDAQFGYVFEHFRPVRSLRDFIAAAGPREVEAVRGDPARFAGRGQLGRYWAALPPIGG